jgi:hypothetical protein
MGGGGDSGGESTNEIRYAPYIESHHSAFLDIVANKRDEVIDASPYSGYTDIAYADAFFGAGYVISSFPSLYDMYGKFMAGLDVDVLFTQILDDSINNTAIDNRVSAHAGELEDDIIESATPRFVAGMRDINSVLSSSFVVGKAMLETARTKAISRYDATLRHAMLPIATQRWATHLEWNRAVISTYAEIMKLYFSAAMDLDNHNYTMAAKDALWPFTVLDYNRAALGALTGATKTTSDVAGGGPSTAQKAIGGALAGAAAGAMVAGPWGAVAGGVIGAASAFL